MATRCVPFLTQYGMFAAYALVFGTCIGRCLLLKLGVAAVVVVLVVIVDDDVVV